MYQVESLDHTADIFYRVTADSLEDLLRGCARAVWNTMTSSDPPAQADAERFFREKSKDPEELVLNFLREVVYLNSLGEGLVFDWQDRGSAFEKGLEGVFLLTRRLNEIIIDTEVKAVTYCQFHLERKENQWSVQFILDV